LKVAGSELTVVPGKLSFPDGPVGVFVAVGDGPAVGGAPHGAWLHWRKLIAALIVLISVWWLSAALAPFPATPVATPLCCTFGFEKFRMTGYWPQADP
jgi:hypothetical protein